MVNWKGPKQPASCGWFGCPCHHQSPSCRPVCSPGTFPGTAPRQLLVPLWAQRHRGGDKVQCQGPGDPGSKVRSSFHSGKCLLSALEEEGDPRQHFWGQSHAENVPRGAGDSDHHSPREPQKQHSQGIPHDDFNCVVPMVTSSRRVPFLRDHVTFGCQPCHLSS